MKNPKFIAFVAAIALLLVLVVFLVYRQEMSQRPKPKAGIAMQANRAKPATPELPGLDMPEVKGKTEEPGSGTLPKKQAGKAKQANPVDFAALLSQPVASQPQPVASQPQPIAPQPQPIAPQPQPVAPKLPINPEVGNLTGAEQRLAALEAENVKLAQRLAEVAQRAAVSQQGQESTQTESLRLRQELTRVGGNSEAFKAMFDALVQKVGALEQQLNSKQRAEGKLGFLNQGNPSLVGRTREHVSPVERGELLANLPGLERTLKVEKQAVNVTATHRGLTGTNSIQGFVQALLQLACTGADVHLIVGEPNPRNRPIWLEMYTETGLTILHPELDVAAFQNLNNRKTLPTVFGTGAYGVTFTDGQVETYRLAR